MPRQEDPLNVEGESLGSGGAGVKEVAGQPASQEKEPSDT